MTRFRQWILSLAIALALLVPFAGTASADPSDPGTTFSASTAPTTVPTTPRGGRPTYTATSDPSDPGTGW
jgi:hypothetical protein